MFQGDIAQFAPADLLLFLSHMDKEGVLTVRRDGEALSLSFRGRFLVDASCEPAEELVLATLARHEAATPAALDYLRRARDETGLPLSRILDDVEWLSVDDAGEAVAAGVRETVFRLLLWEEGAFRFTELAVDDNPQVPPLDAQALVMDLTREVDEYRELLRSLGSLARPVRAAVAQPSEASAEEAYVLAHAGAAATADELLDHVPFPRLEAAWAVATAVENGWLAFAGAGADADADDAAAADTGVFPAYRQTLRRLLVAPDDEARFREVVGFAQAHATQSILCGVRDGVLRRATIYRRDATGRLTASDHRDPDVDLAADLVFHQAQAAGRPFVGDVFPSPVIDALGAEVPAAACALLPLGPLGNMDLLLYAVTAEPGAPAGPLACLELLAWQVRPPRLDVPRDAGEPVASAATRGLEEPADPAEQLVASIKDLPPMPDVVARILSLLASADCDVNKLVEALSHDPALVAKLIKVSNSALYGGTHEIGSINQAIVRLGMRTTRSVVVAASTRSLFPTDGSRRGLLGRALWEHAVRTGLAARRVAEFTRRADPDEAFAAGVLHDIGKVIILLDLPERYAEVQQRLAAGATDSVAAERDVLGFDHTLVGDRLLTNWGMPGDLRAAARWHHAPEQAEASVPLATVVACADLLGRGGAEDAPLPARDRDRLAATCAFLELDEAARTDLAALFAQDLAHSDLLD